jgi:hypothetical protein
MSFVGHVSGVRVSNIQLGKSIARVQTCEVVVTVDTLA